MGMIAAVETVANTSGTDLANRLPGQPPARTALSLSDLFLSFLCLGAVAFGGPAMVASIREMAVTRKRWVDEAAFARGVALCLTIPGATAMQTAAYVGLRTRGIAGGMAAYTGFALPAFGVMLALAVLYGPAHQVPVTASLFRGLRVIVVAILANAALQLGRSYVRRWQDGLIAAGAAVALAGKISPLLVIAMAGVAGVLAGSPAPGGRVGSPMSHPTTWRPPALMLGCAACVMTALFALNRQLFALAAAMLQIDVFAFGGGFASIPLMQHQFVSVLGWLDSTTFTDGVALGQVTPGPIVITATFVGYLVNGLPGALVGTAAILFPSFVVLVLALPYFDRMQGSPVFRGATRGALSSFVGLLLAVTCDFGLRVDWTVPLLLIACGVFAGLQTGVRTVWLVIGGGICAMRVA